MQMTFRWFGADRDSVSLNQIKQIPGVTGIVAALHGLPAGELWTEEMIKAMYDDITEAGFSMECIESVNVHEDIKIGLPSRDKYIDNYINMNFSFIFKRRINNNQSSIILNNSIFNVV